MGFLILKPIHWETPGDGKKPLVLMPCHRSLFALRILSSAFSKTKWSGKRRRSHGFFFAVFSAAWAEKRLGWADRKNPWKAMKSHGVFKPEDLDSWWGFHIKNLGVYWEISILEKLLKGGLRSKVQHFSHWKWWKNIGGLRSHLNNEQQWTWKPKRPHTCHHEVSAQNGSSRTWRTGYIRIPENRIFWYSLIRRNFESLTSIISFHPNRISKLNANLIFCWGFLWWTSDCVSIFSDGFSMFFRLWKATFFDFSDASDA